MACAITATGQHFTRTTGSMPTTVSFTRTIWARLDVDRNVEWCLHGQRDATNKYAYIYNVAADGTTAAFELENSGATTITGPNMVVGTWYFLAWGRSGTGANLTFFTHGTAAAASLTVVLATSALGSVTPTQEIFGSSQFNTSGSWFNGRWAAFKEWNTALTQAEIEKERWFYVPQRRVNLLAWRPFIVGGAVAGAQNDFSGNGLTLSVGTGSSTLDGPPIAWAPRPMRQRRSGGVAGPTLLDVAGSLGVSGEMRRDASQVLAGAL